MQWPIPHAADPRRRRASRSATAPAPELPDRARLRRQPPRADPGRVGHDARHDVRLERLPGRRQVVADRDAVPVVRPDATEEVLSAAVAGGVPVAVRDHRRTRRSRCRRPTRSGRATVIPQPYAPINGDAGDASTVELEWSVVGAPDQVDHRAPCRPPPPAAGARLRGDDGRRAARPRRRARAADDRHEGGADRAADGGLSRWPRAGCRGPRAARAGAGSRASCSTDIDDARRQRVRRRRRPGRRAGPRAGAAPHRARWPASVDADRASDGAAVGIGGPASPTPAGSSSAAPAAAPT